MGGVASEVGDVGEDEEAVYFGGARVFLGADVLKGIFLQHGRGDRDAW